MMLHVAEELAKRGFRVDLLVPRSEQLQDGPPGLQVKKLGQWPRSIGRYMALRADPGGFKSLLKPVLLPLFIAQPLGHMPALVRYLRSEQPDGLIVGTTYMNLAAVWSRKISGSKAKLLISERDNLSQNLRTGRVGRAWRWQHVPALIKRTYPMADAVIGVSKGVTEDLETVASLPEGLAKTIYNPVVTDELFDLSLEKPDDPWLAPGEPPLILAAGRLVAKKDYPTLLRGFARLRRDRAARLMILGKGKEQRKLERLAADLGIAEDVRFAGWIDNVYGYMAQASVFALTSRREGLPGVLIQAMASGCPVVSTDCPSGPSEILEEGRIGRLIPMGDDQALSAALMATLDDPPDKAMLKAHAAAYTAERAVDAYLEALGFSPMPAAA